MGTGPSRSVNIRNPEPPGKIIQITEDVAKRMTSRYGQTTSRSSSESQIRTEPETSPKNSPPVQQQIPQQGIFNVGAQGFPVVETVNAYQVRQEKDREIRSNDDFWASKLRELEAKYVAAAFAAEGEFNKELEKIDKLVPKPMEPVCQEFTAKVAQCYKENSNETLRCSDVVRQFALCVEQKNFNKKTATAA